MGSLLLQVSAILSRIRIELHSHVNDHLSAELEELLLTHEHIQDAAVVQVPDENSGELPRAYVVLKQTANKVTDQQLKDWVRERVAPQKRLDGGVIFIDQIPKSASGKILRRLLPDEAKKEFV